MRLLITGSRTWPQEARGATSEALQRVAGRYPPGEVTLVSGACPQGADAMCEEIALELGWQVELHPAKWTDDNGKYDRAAGFRRNKEMVESKPDVTVAFIMDNSKGATHTYNLSIEADIPTFAYYLTTAQVAKWRIV